MNKEIIAGIIFMSVWVIGLLVWGSFNNSIPNKSSTYSSYQDVSPQEECFTPGYGCR